MAPKFDVYAHVTDTIIAEIEAGTPPWRKPWTGSTSGIALPKRYNGEAYRGINILMLWVMAAKNGYVSSRWMTYRQAKELGGQVRGGETSATVVKYGTFTRENELGVDEELPYARAYRVFKAADYYVRPDAPRDLGTEADPELAAFFARTGAEIITSEDPRAYYNPVKDHIHMPPIATFHNAAGYYGTLAHEPSTGPAAKSGLSGSRNLRTARLTRSRSWWLRLARVSLAHRSGLHRNLVKARLMSRAG